MKGIGFLWCPHLYSAGIPLKLVEAMAHGLPAVVSALTAEQLGLKDGEEVLVGRNPAELAEKIVRLHSDGELWAHLSQRCVEFVQANFDKQNMMGSLTAALASFKRQKRGFFDFLSKNDRFSVRAS